MPLRLFNEFETLKTRILSIGAEVESQVRKAVRAIEHHDLNLARQVLEGDMRIDQLEVDLEEDCLKALALYQPVAHDLRFLIAILKINSDLERIGDLAVNIAERVPAISRMKTKAMPFDFETICEITQDMLKKSLDALVRFDTRLAFEVLATDSKVDEINRKIYQTVEDEVQKNPQDINYFIHLMGVYRQLERIADHATNIAEDVVYLTKGEIIRHRGRQFQFDSKQEP